MKYLTIIFIFSVGFFIFANTGYMQNKNKNTSDLRLKINSPKDQYYLGEEIIFSFTVSNNGSKTVSFSNSINVNEGYLNVFVSEDGKNFYQYNHDKWGIGEAISIYNLKPAENVMSSAGVLWNLKPEIVGLNENVAKKASEGRILSDYIFPKTGKYFIKASYQTYLSDDRKTVKIESAPIQISIENPVNEDLEVWNKIKDNGEFAYFIQEGDVHISSYKPEERAKFIQEVEQILIDYPNSFYAQSLRKSLDKFKAIEARRTSSLNKQIQ